MTEQDKILIAGATGTVGRELVARLAERQIAVRALVRDPESANLLAGVECVRGDLADPASLTAPLAGVEKMFLVWPFTSERAATEIAPAVVETIAQRVRRVVYLSADAATDNPDRFWARLERLIERSAEEFTFLRPTGFAKNTLMWAPQIRARDVVRWPYGAAARSLIDERDIAADHVEMSARHEFGEGAADMHAAAEFRIETMASYEDSARRFQREVQGDGEGRPGGRCWLVAGPVNFEHDDAGRQAVGHLNIRAVDADETLRRDAVGDRATDMDIRIHPRGQQIALDGRGIVGGHCNVERQPGRGDADASAGTNGSGACLRGEAVDDELVAGGAQPCRHAREVNALREILKIAVVEIGGARDARRRGGSGDGDIQRQDAAGASAGCFQDRIGEREIEPAGRMERE